MEFLVLNKIFDFSLKYIGFSTTIGAAFPTSKVFNIEKINNKMFKQQSPTSNCYDLQN